MVDLPNSGWVQLLTDHVRRLRPTLEIAKGLFVDDYFYGEDLIKLLLWERDLMVMPKGDFLDYTRWRHYYQNQRKNIFITAHGNSQERELPYQELVDYISEPTAKIIVKGGILLFQMAPSLSDLTKHNLEAYIKEKQSKGGKAEPKAILRVSSFTKMADGSYSCQLETASYHSQIRTNLTIDYPLPDTSQSLRTMDLGEDRSLRAFEDSILVNSIGVSAVVYYVDKGHRRRYFFMKLRKESEGVFEKMFGSTSGVGSPKVRDDNNKNWEERDFTIVEEITELGVWAKEAMKGEFERETGLKNSESETLRFVPLAFTRELTRGGKPQFFFLIEIRPQTPKLFRKEFRRSEEGLEEFYDSFLKNKASWNSALTPEFYTNLIYALEYFQKQDKLLRAPVHLD